MSPTQLLCCEINYSSGFFLSKENAFELKTPKHFPQEKLTEE